MNLFSYVKDFQKIKYKVVMKVIDEDIEKGKCNYMFTVFKNEYLKCLYI